MAKKKTDPLQKREVKLRASDGFMALEITAQFRSRGLVGYEMTARKRRLAKHLHDVAQALDFNPLEISVS